MAERRIEVQPSRQDLRVTEKDENDGAAGRESPAEDPEQVSAEELRRQRRKLKMRAYAVKCVKRGVRMTGFIVLTFGWIAVGGFMFRALEETNYIESCKSARLDYEGNENATLELIMDMVSRLDGISTYSSDKLKRLENDFLQRLNDFGESVIGTGRDVNSTDCDTLGTDDNPTIWHFFAAALFSMTIAATIGYGNIAPVTDWGRIVCIAYALVGMPVFMFTLVSAGSILSDLVELCYTTFCCLGCCRKRRSPSSAAKKGNDDGEVLIATEDGHALEKHGSGGDRRSSSSAASIRGEESGALAAVTSIEEEGADEEEGEEEETPKLPVTFSLLFLVGILALGGAIFQYNEEWEFDVAFYFSFITITSIGFGDFVPGSTGKASTVLMRSLTGILYIIFGMAAFSMVVTLIVDEMSAKVEWFSAKCRRRRQGGVEDEVDEREEAELERQMKSVEAAAPPPVATTKSEAVPPPASAKRTA